MKSTTMIITALSAAGLAYGHGLPTKLSVSGGSSYELYDPFTDPYIPEVSRRPARTSWTTPGNGPVEDVSLRDIACNGATASGFTSEPGAVYASAAAGSDVSITWDRWPSDHKGPIMTYMANCNGDCKEADPTTLDWFKISHAGLHEDGATWATDDLISNNLVSNTKIPSDIKAGKYLLRHEILALHSASETNGAQFYPVCVNMEISGSGSAVPSDTVRFPGAYKADDAGIKFDIWWPVPLVDPYVIPGPAVYESGSAPASSSAAVKPTSTKATSSSAEAAPTTSEAAATSETAVSATTVEPETPGYGYGEPSTSDVAVEPASTSIPVGTGTGFAAPTGTAPSGSNFSNYGPGPAQTLAPTLVPESNGGSGSGNGNGNSNGGAVTSTYVQTVIQTAVVTMTKTVAETQTVTVTPEGSVCTPVGRYRRDIFNW